MNNLQNNQKSDAAQMGYNALLGTVAYEPCVLVARKEQVYTADGKFMFSVSMTERAKQLLDNDGWEKGKESWLDYRKRTEKERELEQQKQYKLAADLAEFFNKATGNCANTQIMAIALIPHQQGEAILNQC